MPDDKLKPLFGRFGMVGTQVDGHFCIVDQYAQFLQLLQVSAQFGKAARGSLGQYVGTQWGVVVGVENDFGNGPVQIGFALSQICFGNDAPCLIQIQTARTRRKDTGLVFAAFQQIRPLQPCQGCFDFGVRLPVVAVEAHVSFGIPQDFPTRYDNGVIFRFARYRAVQEFEFAPYGLQIALLELREAAEAELGIHVRTVEQQHAFCLLLVASRPSRFLKIVFQRTGNLGMNHQPHIGLVHAHAERVGRNDDP